MTEKKRYSLWKCNYYKNGVKDNDENAYYLDEEVVDLLNEQEERIQEYEKLIKQILYETRANYTGRQYSICVSVFPQMYGRLNELLENKMQEEF